MKLSEVMELVAGPNRTRLSGTINENDLYSVSSIDDDLNQLKIINSEKHYIDMNYHIREGDLIISNFKKKAAVASSISSGKILTSNFCKCNYNKDLLDPWYFCYFVNETNEFKKQIEKEGFRAFSNALLCSLEIVLPELELQRKIGRAYKVMCRQNYLLEKQQDAYRRLIIESIKKISNIKEN